MTGVVKRGSYSYASGDTGIRGDAEVAESTNGSVRIELTLDGKLYGIVTLHHTMWAQIVSDFPGPPQTHRQMLTALLDEMGVTYRTNDDTGHINIEENEIAINASDGPLQDGYSGFFVLITFDEAGNLTKFGVWE